MNATRVVMNDFSGQSRIRYMLVMHEREFSRVISLIDLVGLVGLVIAGMVACAVNSVAGGGTLISLPALVAFGQPALISNATSMGATGVGSISSALGYRKDTTVQWGLFLTLAIPSLIGALLGAVILVNTPAESFRQVVPYLVLFATLLLASRNIITRRLGHGCDGEERVTIVGRVFGVVFQLFVAMYGGYFSAGCGIMMLGAFNIMGLRNIHKMNALKTPLGAIINLVAFVFLAFEGLVVWPLAILMSIGGIVGGYGSARLAVRVNPRLIQYVAVAIGLIVSGWFFAKSYWS